MSIPLPLSLLLVLGVLFTAQGANIVAKKDAPDRRMLLSLRWVLIALGSGLITVWATVAGLE